MNITTINPATEQKIATYDYTSPNNLLQMIELGHRAAHGWSKKSIAERAHYFKVLEQNLLSNKTSYARLISTEMGKPFEHAVSEIEKCALVCSHFADMTSTYLSPRHVKTDLAQSYVTYQPLGLIFAIMPWNFPFWQVFRFAAPALMAGNAALLKHAPITTGCGLAIEQAFKEAGFPQHVFQNVILDNEQSAQVIADERIAAVTLTGSKRTGELVAAASGAALKKCVLELGGSDPYLIFEDADLELAAQAVVASRMNNAGQSCVAAKRIITIGQVGTPFQKLVENKLKSQVMGNPLDPHVTFGPLAREDLRTTLHQQVQQSIACGAKLLQGGYIPQQPGFFYPITILTNVSKGMPAYDEELFGPVFCFLEAENESDAIKIANDTPYGLSAALFTQDVVKAEYLAAYEIQAGTIFINAWVRSDPRLPFGGIKNSGFGRELSCEGIHEFVNIKTIGIK